MCVLPVPVTPYAKIVTSNPLKRCLTVGATLNGQHEHMCRLFIASRTFALEDLLLDSMLVVDTVELKAIQLCMVLWVRDADQVLSIGLVTTRRRDNDILFDFLFQERTNASYDAHTHFD